MKGEELSFPDFRYGRGQLNDSTWGQSYAEWFQQLGGLLEDKQKSTGGIFDNIKYLILFSVKCKYVIRNTGKGRKNEGIADSYEGLRRNTDDSVTPMSHPSQRYDVTWLISYAVTYFMPTTWKASSALYGVTLYKVTP
ncbi:hypothetical protein Tco_0319665 [Tanacetum coccineum]